MSFYAINILHDLLDINNNKIKRKFGTIVIVFGDNLHSNSPNAILK